MFIIEETSLTNDSIFPKSILPLTLTVGGLVAVGANAFFISSCVGVSTFVFTFTSGGFLSNKPKNSNTFCIAPPTHFITLIKASAIQLTTSPTKVPDLANSLNQSTTLLNILIPKVSKFMKILKANVATCI